MNRKSRFIYSLNKAYARKKSLRVRFKLEELEVLHDLVYEGFELAQLKHVVVTWYNSDLTSDSRKIVSWEILE